MRRRINQALYDYLKEVGENYTVDELLPKVNEMFNESYSRLRLQQYLYRNEIKYKYTNEKLSHPNCLEGYPLGTEYVKGDGMTIVKVARNKWKYKQRLIYEQYYNVELSSDDYIIFLDGDRTNFDINNLKLVSREVSSYLANFKLKSVDPDVTKLGIDVANLMITAKGKKKYDKS